MTAENSQLPQELPQALPPREWDLVLGSARGVAVMPRGFGFIWGWAGEKTEIIPVCAIRERDEAISLLRDIYDGGESFGTHTATEEFLAKYPVPSTQEKV